MSITTATNKFPYTGNAATTAFAFPSLFYDNSEIKVYLDGVVATTGFTITGAGNPSGGTVTFSVAPANGVAIVLARIVPYTRTSNYVDGSDAPADTFNRDLDELTMQTQQLSTKIANAIAFPDSYTGAVPYIESITADSTLAVSTDGTKIIPGPSSNAITAAAAAAAASAAAAANAAAAYSGTSTTSVAIATGAKSFTATTGKLWTAGQLLQIASSVNSANYMHGAVTSYNPTTGALVMNILDVGGSGTLASWNISISGSRGPAGASGALPDGNYGAVTVSASGTAIAINAGAVGPTELASTAVTPGTYTNMTATVDQDGRITNASSNASAGAGRLLDVQVFTSSGTWTKPVGTVAVEVEVVGGGAGGAGAGAGTTGTDGGDSSFGSWATAHGGLGGNGSSATSNPGGAGGTATGGTINVTGQKGGDGGTLIGGDGGDGKYGTGGIAANSSATTPDPANGYGAGGAGRTGTNPGGGGGAAGYAYKYIASGLGATESVIVGAAGVGGYSGLNSGSAGIVIVKSYS